MKAVVWTKYGSPDGLCLREVKKPVPGDDDVLIKIHATTVTAGDCEMRKLALPLGLSFPVRIYAGLIRPKRISILGQELAGEIERVGKNVKSYRAGDQVFGTTGFRFGAYAEYICLPAKPNDVQGALAAKPENLTYEEAAAVPTAGLEALHYIRRAAIKRGHAVLIVGGGGSIGTFSIQLAKKLGAEVTGVDGPGKLDLMRSTGADHVIDYTKEDYTDDGKRYDLVIDVVGRRSVSRRLGLLREDGTCFLAFARPQDVVLSIWVSITSHKKLIIESAKQTSADLAYLKDLIEAGDLRPVVDRSYPLEQVAEAHRFVESGHKKGNVAITVYP
jgi:NADPH:quinone reductase-like Zn-dependent oxidoreductase